MTNGVRKSLSPKEHALRAQFEAMRRDDERRAELWSDVQAARARGAREKQRLFVTVRLQEGTGHMASCLIADLGILKTETQRWGVPDPSRIDAYVKCELLFGAGLPPCDRAGACPHEIVVFAMKSDNGGSELSERAWEALRQLAMGEGSGS